MANTAQFENDVKKDIKSSWWRRKCKRSNSLYYSFKICFKK